MELRYTVRPIGHLGPWIVYDTRKGQMAWLVKGSDLEAEDLCDDLNRADLAERHRSEAITKAAHKVRRLLREHEQLSRVYAEAATSSWSAHHDEEARGEEVEYEEISLICEGLRQMLAAVGEGADE